MRLRLTVRSASRWQARRVPRPSSLSHNCRAAHRTITPLQKLPLPKIGDVVDRMVERAKRQDEEGVELGYESRITTTIDTLNDDGEVTKTERTLHKRYRVEDQTVRGAHRVKRASAHRERTKGRARPTREVCARGEEESRRGRCAARDERRTSGPSRVGPHHQVPSLARRGRHDRRRAVLGRRLQTA